MKYDTMCVCRYHDSPESVTLQPKFIDECLKILNNIPAENHTIMVTCRAGPPSIDGMTGWDRTYQRND